MEITPEIQERLNKLSSKYDSMGQNMESYLDGLLFSNVLPYWEYIKVDSLLTLQTPKTDFPDEMVFIIYHQVTELYFKLTLLEMKQICKNGKIISNEGEDMGWNKKLDGTYFTQRLHRINRYFEALTHSFDIMVQGMEKEQFLKFRMALLPGSGFQSAQYRMIEIHATDFIRLTHKDQRASFSEKDGASIKEMFEHIYWKEGATELETGKKTLTLRMFEEKYTNRLIALAEKYKSMNLWQKYKQLPDDEKTDKLKNELRQFDVNVNVNWPLVHYKSAVRYLQLDPEDIPATGGTNWQKYLPPRFQKRIFYPELWSNEEIENWGKGWVDSVLSEKK